jgi:hypothetical protein
MGLNGAHVIVAGDPGQLQVVLNSAVDAELDKI